MLIIHNVCAQEGTVPTISKLLVKFKESINVKGSYWSLRRNVYAVRCMRISYLNAS
jgi:hypothetical protein